METKPNEIQITFSHSVDPASVLLANFKLSGRGPDGLFGTEDDLAITPLNASVPEGQGNVAVLALNGVPMGDDVYRLVLDGTAKGYVARHQNYMSVPDFGLVIPTQKAFTVEFWQYFTGPDTHIPTTFGLEPLQAGNEWRFHSPWNSYNYMFWVVGSDSLGIQNVNTYGVWTHFAAIYNFETHTYKVYRNGTLLGSKGSTQTFTPYAAALQVPRSGTQPFLGYVDEFRVWDHERTAEQVAAYFQRTVPGDAPGLVGCWSFNEGTGATTKDLSPNARHGTLQGTISWEASGAPLTEGIRATLGAVLDGDADGAHGGSYTMQFTLQAAAPTVVSTLPAHASTGASLTQPIEVTFSEQMNHSATEAAVSIEPDFAKTFSWSGNTLRITPDASLTENTAYTVTLGTGAQDEGGASLASAHVLSFTSDYVTIGTVNPSTIYRGTTTTGLTLTGTGFAVASASVPSGSSGYGGHYYKLISSSTNWSAAKSYCESQGGYLAAIGTSGENDFVKNLGGGSTLWIGFTDSSTEGNWQWVSGDAVTYTNWAGGEPNNVGNEDVAMMYSDGKWNDGSGSASYPFVCEWNDAPPSVKLKRGPAVIEAFNVRVVSATEIKFDVTLPPNAELTAWDIEIINPNGGDSATLAGQLNVSQQPPAAVNNFYGMFKNDVLSVPAPGVLGNDTDPEGGGMTAILVAAPAAGTFNLDSNGSFQFAPPPGATGTFTFTYTARDNANADSAVTTVEIEVCDPANGLLGWWKLDENGGTKVWDSSGYNNEGDLQNGPVFLPTGGMKAGALQLDGSNDTARIHDSFSLQPASKISVAVWAKPSNPKASALSNLVRKAGNQNPGYIFRWSGGGELEFWVGNNSSNNSSVNDPDPNTPFVGAWHHFVGTFDGATGVVRIYVDGALHVSNNAAPRTINHSDDLYLGGGFGEVFPGLLDDVRIYDRVLSEAEILTLAQVPPVAAADRYVATIDQTLNVAAPGVLGNDTDLNTSQTLTASKISDPAHGSLTFNSDGSFAYTPHADYSGPDSFTYKVHDGLEDGNTATVDLWVYRALNVTALSPVPGSVLGASPAQIVATFSDNLDAASVHSDTFRLIGRGLDRLFGTADDVTVTASSITVAGNQATFNVQGSLPNDVYRVVLASGDLEAGLAANWKFDEAGGTTAFDSSGNGLNGTLNGGPVWEPNGGVLEGSLYFDGGNDYVIMGDILNDLSLPVSFSFWVKESSPYIRTPFVSDDNNSDNIEYGFLMSITPNNGLEARFGSGTGTGLNFRRKTSGDGTVPQGVWAHITAVMRGAQDISLYVNGVDVGGSYDGTGEGYVAHSSHPFRIGQDFGNLEAFSGSLDDFRIYRRALAQSEVKALAGVASVPGIRDTAGNALDGEFTGAFPSGDGLPYGDFIATFSLPGPVLKVDALSFTHGQIFATPPAQLTATLNKAAAPETVHGQSVRLLRSGPDGAFETADDVTVTPVGVSLSGANQVVVNLSGLPLHNDQYRLVLSGSAPGGAIAFDGGDDFVKVPHHAALNSTEALTVEAWANFESGGAGDPRLVSKGDNAYFELYTQGTGTSRKFGALIQTAAGTVTLLSAGAYAAGAWHHVAMTYNRLKLRLFVNGALAGETASTAALLPSLNHLNFGRRSGTFNDWYKGRLDEVRIWSVARTLGALEANRFRSLTGSEPGLIGYWTCDGSTQAVGDATAHALHGTLGNNDTAAADDPTRVASTAPLPGIQDLFDQTLDGEFNGTLPSGNGVGGGDFVASFSFNQPLLRVTSVSPGHQQILSAQPANVVVTFDGNVDAASVTTSSFKVIRRGADMLFGTADDIQIAPDDLVVNGNQATFSLAGLSLIGDVYRVVVGDPRNYGLYLHYAFDEAGGSTAMDVSGNGRNGSMVNGPSWSSGVAGGALHFTEHTQHIVTALDDVPRPWTAAMWVKREATPQSNAQLTHSSHDLLGGSLRLEQYSNTNKVGVTKFYTGTDTNHPYNYTAPIDTWVHLAFVGTSSGTDLYVNGALQDTCAVTLDLPLYRIGGAYDSIIGTLDDFRVYSRALTSAELGEVYNGTGTIVGTGGEAFDGEFSGSFPSGDGAPGGVFISEFTINSDPVVTSNPWANPNPTPLGP